MDQIGGRDMRPLVCAQSPFAVVLPAVKKKEEVKCAVVIERHRVPGIGVVPARTTILNSLGFRT